MYHLLGAIWIVVGVYITNYAIKKQQMKGARIEIAKT
ncbi:hypothetical protein QFZ77_003508 [Paenibacillus sp. V4I3]|nr:hypothetical protein [Paenibacillus sp. V4I3]